MQTGSNDSLYTTVSYFVAKDNVCLMLAVLRDSSVCLFARFLPLGGQELCLPRFIIASYQCICLPRT